MTIRLELGAQTALQGRLLLLPNQDAGDAPLLFACTLRNIGTDTITVTQIGGTDQNNLGRRDAGWAVQDTDGTYTDFDLAPQATRTINMRVMPLSDANALDAGIWSGVCFVEWRLASASAGSQVLQSVGVTGIVKNTALPDLRLTKDQLFSKHFVMHLPAGGAGGPNWGIRPGIIDGGYTQYFTDEVPRLITWAGLSPGHRIKVFIDRWTGNSLASRNSGDLPFDGLVDLMADTNPARNLARTTLVDGFAYLGTLDCDIMMYMGSMANDLDFLDLANAGDTVGLMQRLNASLEPILRLPNLHTMIFDDPFGLTVSDARSRLYECMRRVCQARGVNVCAEPRGAAVDPTMLPSDGVGICVAHGYGQLTNPDWVAGFGFGPSQWRSDATAAGLEYLDWMDGIDRWQGLARIAGTRIRSHLLGRSDNKPMRQVSNPWSYDRGERVITAQALTDIVNAYIAVVTGDATQTVMDGDVSILP